MIMECNIEGCSNEKVWEPENSIMFQQCRFHLTKEQFRLYVAQLTHKLKLVRSDADYAYKTIAEYEEIVGYECNNAFRIGWDMARTTNTMLRKLTGK